LILVYTDYGHVDRLKFIEEVIVFSCINLTYTYGNYPVYQQFCQKNLVFRWFYLTFYTGFILREIFHFTHLITHTERQNMKKKTHDKTMIGKHLLWNSIHVSCNSDLSCASFSNPAERR